MNLQEDEQLKVSGLPAVPELSVPELVPVAEFLQQTLPFNELPLQALYQTVPKIVVQYHCQLRYRVNMFAHRSQRCGRNPRQ